GHIGLVIGKTGLGSERGPDQLIAGAAGEPVSRRQDAVFEKTRFDGKVQFVIGFPTIIGIGAALGVDTCGTIVIGPRTVGSEITIIGDLVIARGAIAAP